MQLDWRLLEHSELMVEYQAPLVSFLLVKFFHWQITTTLFLFLFCSGLDWKVFKSSCLPKKFREDVTFGGTTYKVSGIPDGKRKKKKKSTWGF